MSFVPFIYFSIRLSQTRAYGMALSVCKSCLLSLPRDTSLYHTSCPLSVVFQLTHAQVHISLQIKLILSIKVYDHKTLNEFDNHHDPIQNGRPAAILFFWADTLSKPQFSMNQLHT